MRRPLGTDQASKTVERWVQTPYGAPKINGKEKTMNATQLAEKHVQDLLKLVEGMDEVQKENTLTTYKYIFDQEAGELESA